MVCLIPQYSSESVLGKGKPHKLHSRDGRVTSVEFEYTEFSATGQLAGTGAYFKIEADVVFKAIGQKFDAALLDQGQFPELESGRIKVNVNRKTSLDGVYAGGDCVAGVDLTVVAVQDGKLAAKAIHNSLMEEHNG